MAVVPIQTDRVLPNPSGPSYLSSNVSPNAFGLQSAQAKQQGGAQLEQAGAQIAAAGQRIRNEDNAEELKALDIEYADYTRKISYGDGTPENPGFLNVQGKNAEAAYKDAAEKLDQKRAELVARASNDKVRKAFNLSSLERRSTEDTRYLDHVADQRNKASIDSSNARMQLGLEDAADAYKTPEVIARSLAINGTEIANIAAKTGMDADTAKATLQAQNSKVVEAAVTSALKAQDTGTASKLMQLFDGEMDGTTRAKLKGMMSDVTDLATAQSSTDKIMAVPGITLSERLELARKITNPKVRAAVEQSVSARTNQELQSHNIMVEQVAQKWAQQIAKGETMASLGLANPDEATLISSSITVSGQLRAAQTAVAEGRLFAATSDGKTFTTIQGMDQERLAKLSQAQVELIRPQLTKQEYSQFTSMWNGARKSISGDLKSSAVYGTADTVLSRIAPPDLKWGQKDIADRYKVQQNAVRNQMYAYIDQKIRDGHVPTHADLVGEANRLFLPVRSGKGAFSAFLPTFIVGDTADMAFELQKLTPEERKTYTVPLDKVLPEVKNQAKLALKAAGLKNVDDALLEQFFGAEALGDAARQRSLVAKALQDQR